MAFSIVVLVKQTPDLNAIRVDKATGKPLLGDQLVISSADAIAVEAALQLKEAHAGEVTIVSAGPASVRDVITRALAMGADRGIHLQVDGMSKIDTLGTARLLAESVRDLGLDLLLAGQNSDDYESGQVGAQVAELLGLPQISWVTKLEVVGDELSFERDTEDGKQVVVASTPLVVLTADGLNEPRYPSLKGIMAAKKKTIDTVVPAEIPVAAGISWSDPIAPSKTAAGIILQDKPASEAVAELVDWLKTNKLINN
ncbi:electron transfer flavoprotein subunit beta/FixA family protein [soil metagenome]